MNTIYFNRCPITAITANRVFFRDPTRRNYFEANPRHYIISTCMSSKGRTHFANLKHDTNITLKKINWPGDAACQRKGMSRSFALANMSDRASE